METTRTEQALAYVRSKSGSGPALARACGLGYQWMLKFRQGHIRNPAEWRITAILEHRDRQTAA